MPIRLMIASAGIVGGGLYLRSWAKAREARDRALLAEMIARISQEQKSRDARVLPPSSPFEPAVRHDVFIPPPAPVIPVGPRQVSGESLSPTPGALYRVTVDVNFPTSIGVGEGSVKKQAQDHGFSNVIVTKQKPSGWPGQSGSYYVTGTYTGGPAAMARSYLGGQVNIKDVWEG